MNHELFKMACDTVIYNTKLEDSIGTLSEKTIHAVIKNYLEPDTNFHEIKVKNYYADICTPDGIIEIQTRNFDKLRRKLDVFLELSPVTIVYPIAYHKWLRWVNNESGEVSSPRKSPKKGVPYLIFPELYKIKNYLLHPNIRFLILLINVEEYRYLDGWSKDKKKGSTRCDGIPLELIDEISINSIDDYTKLLPDNLPDNFTTKDYSIATKTTRRISTVGLNILHHTGAIKRIGKEKNSYLYTK